MRGEIAARETLRTRWRVLRRETCDRLDERALGIEAEMIFGVSTCPCEKEVPPAPLVALRNDGACLSRQNHCSGKPDGAAAKNSDYGDCIGLA